MDDNDNDNDEGEDQDEGEGEGEGEEEGDDDDNDQDDEGDQDDDDEGDADGEPESPSQSRRQSRVSPSTSRPPNPTVMLTSPSPRPSAHQSPNMHLPWPSVRQEAINAATYDIVPTMAAPQSTSINALTATPDMRWVFSGGSDGYIRMYNWVETANGKVPLTVAQKHPFVDSVMKAGSLTTYWENEEHSVRTPPAQSAEEPKDSSPVYSLATQHQATWLLSGLESGAINLQTCRHQAGTNITALREHTSAVSVLSLAQDEYSFLSGSWDKTILDWDLNMGKVKRSFIGSGSQISALERRPESALPVPRVAEDLHVPSSTFSSNNAAKPLTNGVSSQEERRGSKNSQNGTEDAAGSPDGSLFGDDNGSLFGDDNINADNNNNNNAFDDDDEFAKAIATGLQQSEQEDTEMLDAGGPVQPPQDDSTAPADPMDTTSQPQADASTTDQPDPLSMGNPHAEEITTNGHADTTEADLPQTSSSTFLDTSIDGTLRIWDQRVSNPIAVVHPSPGIPPWCMGACWSVDGNTIYAGRRNGTVEEYSLHKGFQMGTPQRTFKFPGGSGPVSAVRAMPNGRHLICSSASYDILRLYDLRDVENARSTVPFLIVPGHRTGVISALHIDPACRFMISTAGNRGWEGASTEVMLGYEIGCVMPS
ncbi:WD40 repeat-like protein [Aureobasidium namibiae CBS 147.97]|uniref:WD40 repeat-like protein n=1 Tax=Aureobasidium namibiae CBS 147.97 TaxID=1043004 RepID=A0A074WTB6_9PEZI|nr:WD40 repeat-like protein [Aureobasidium namibiae CBS 147.97]KEQ76450.1 WD40 repeat-like protein [Aureobasidium namibiae CBS 147.97]